MVLPVTNHVPANGFGIAALLIDATVIRSVLLPNATVLLGDYKWYPPPNDNAIGILSCKACVRDALSSAVDFAWVVRMGLHCGDCQGHPGAQGQRSENLLGLWSRRARRRGR